MIKNPIDYRAMTVDELQEVINKAKVEIGQKTNLRKKELWGNVISAISKYEAVVGEKIRVDSPAGFYSINTDKSKSTPGMLMWKGIVKEK